jgi:hypothetical protein
MTSKKTIGAATLAAGADDLTRIRGIGPAVAHRLNAAGVATYDEIAARSAAELSALVGLAGLSAEQIAKKDWVGQAQALAAERSTIPGDELFDLEPLAVEAEWAPVNRQHYATFMVELLLDEENEVRRTRVAHVQGGAEDSWRGWRAEQLLAFFTQSAQLQGPVAKPTLSAQEDPSDIADAGRRAQAHIRGLELVQAGEVGARSFLHDDQSFEVQLTLDFGEAAILVKQPLIYSAAIYAKNLRDRSRHTIGQVRDALSHSDSTIVRLEGTRLPLGTYRLEAVVSTRQPDSQAGAADDLTAFWEGGLVQVY